MYTIACWVSIIRLFFPESKSLELEDVNRQSAKEGIKRMNPMSVDAVSRLSAEAANDKKAAHVESSEDTL